MTSVQLSDPLFQQQARPRTATSEVAQAESTIPVQTSLVIIATVCGCVIAGLLGYIAYLHRARWLALAKEHLHKGKRRSSPVLTTPDNRFDDLEKALHCPPSSVTVVRPSGETASQASKSSREFVSIKNGVRMLDLGPPSTYPSAAKGTRGREHATGPEKQQSTVTSIYTQVLNVMPILSHPRSLRTLTPSLSSKTLNNNGTTKESTISDSEWPFSRNDRISVSLSPLPLRQQVVSASSVESANIQGDDGLKKDSSITTISPSNGILPASLVPSSNASFKVDNDTLAITYCETPKGFVPTSPLALCPGQLSDRMERQRSMAAATTMDEIHDDIKEAYGLLLSMLEGCTFDPAETYQAELQGINRTERLSRKLTRISRLISSNTAVGTRCPLRPEMEFDEGSVEMLNKKLIEMLMQDLISGTSLNLDQMPQSTAPSSQLGSHLSCGGSHDYTLYNINMAVDSTPTKDKEGIDGLSEDDGFPYCSRQDVSSSTTQQLDSQRNESTTPSSFTTTPDLSSSQSTPRLDAAPRPGKVTRGDGWLMANGSPPRPAPMVDSHPPVVRDLESRGLLSDSQVDIGVWRCGRPLGGQWYNDPRSSQSMGSIYGEVDGARSSLSSSDAPGAFHSIAMTPQRLIPSKKRMNYSKSLPFLDRSLFRTALPPNPVLPTDLEAVYPDDSSAHEPHDNLTKIQKSKTFIVAGLRSSFSRLTTLSRRPSEMPASSNEVPPTVVSGALRHKTRSSRDMFIIGDDSDQSTNS